MAEPVVAAPAAAAAAPAQAAAPAAAAVVAAAAAPAAPASIVGSAAAPAAAAAPAPVAIDDAKAFITGKGVTAEDLAKLDEAGIRAKYDELKAAEVKKPAEAAKPGELVLKVPEGITIDEPQLNEFKGILADANLSPQDRGQKLLEMHAASLKAAAQAPYDLWTQTQAKWQAEVKADKEIGGEQFTATNETIAKVLKAIGGAEEPKLRQAFDFTGAGNHPELVRFVVRVGKLLTEGKNVAGDPPGAKKDTAQAIVNAMYPSAAQSQ